MDQKIRDMYLYLASPSYTAKNVLEIWNDFVYVLNSPAFPKPAPIKMPEYIEMILRYKK